MFAAVQRPPRAEPSWLSDATLDVVRPHVRRMLESSPGYRALPQAEQMEIARNMVRVASYMANPDDLARQELGPGGGVLAREEPRFIAPAPAADPAAAPSSSPPTARALSGVNQQAINKATGGVGRSAGADFVDASTGSIGANAKKLMEAVDFPRFVGGLIQNVFQAIVDATIQQMKAYGELLKSVSQSVDQFAQDNISLDNARDYVADKFPDALKVQDNPDGGGKMLAMNEVDDMDAAMARINAELGLAQPIDDISDGEQEARFVQAARLQMARSRQQMLSSMVILGINRIVVTDGMIHAKVVFDFRASDEMMRDAQAGMTDTKSSSNRNTTKASIGLPWSGASTKNENSQRHMTTVSSSVEETSESKQEMKAKLTGEVRVNFKSDYFPMEKLASPAMMAAIQGNSTPVDPNIPPPRAGNAAAAPA